MATYIISPTGSSANPGTVAQPKDLAFINFLMPGDVAQLRGGTYNEILNISNLAGTAINAITIEPYMGESPVFDGNWDNTIHPAVTPGTPSGFQFQAMVNLQDCSFININGLTVQFFDGEGFNANDCNDIVFEDCVVDTIYGGSYRALGNGPGLADVTTSNISFINCRSTRACQAWKWFQTTQGTFFVSNIPSAWLVGRGSTNILIQNCLCELSGAEGINVARGSSNVLVQDCVSRNNRHNNYYLENTYDSTIERCIGYYTHAGVAEIPSMRGFNLVFRDETGAYNQGYDVNYKSRNNTVRNNLFVDGQSGIEAYGKANMVNHTIVNNTLVNNMENILFRNAPTDRDTPTGNVFQNNIILTTDAYTNNPLYDPAETVGNRIVTATGMTYNNNIWHDSINAGSGRPANGVGVGDIEADPLLFNSTASLESGLSTNDFELTTGSPAIDAALNVGLSSDLLNRSYVNGPDIGALEFSAIVNTCANNLIVNGGF